MRLSWSHKLFLRINARLGENTSRDRFFALTARWLIFVLAAYTLFWLNNNFAGEQLVSKMLFFALAVFAALFASSLIGLGARHPRPEAELPGIKQLIKTFSIWKAFPSDHTAAAFLLSFLVWLSGGMIWEWGAMLAAAGLIAASRVYAGVHYPRDIIGGFVLAALFAGIIYFFF